MSLLKGRVARILNSRELAINLGAEHGVKVGMIFRVMDAKGEDIKDPETGEIIGSIPRPKVRVRVTQVFDKVSLAETYRKQRMNIGGIGPHMPDIAKMFTPPKWVDYYETLKTEEKTWEDLDESASYVKTGDPVIQVEEEVEPKQEPTVEVADSTPQAKE